jgi:hypothetical protein
LTLEQRPADCTSRRALSGNRLREVEMANNTAIARIAAQPGSGRDRQAAQRSGPRGVSVLTDIPIPGPVVVEATVDPFVPPMPPRITADQATKFGEALMKGTPNRDKIALTVLSDKVKELL